MNRPPEPTISDVAKAADVSRSTVSRVFSRPERISEATILRVREAAAQLGYSPNPTARALSTGLHRNIAVFVPDVANPFFPPLIAEVQTEAEATDRCVFLGSSGESAEREVRLARRLAAQVEGMVLVSPRMRDEEILVLATRCPLVLVNRDLVGLPRVLIDSAAGTREAVLHLATLGHAGVAYVAGPEASWSNAERRTAVESAGADAGLKVRTVPAETPTFEGGRGAVKALLRVGATAIIAFDDLVAQGVLAGLAEKGVAVPDACSVIGCDDVLGAATWPALTTVSNRSEEAGRKAFQLLLGRLERRDSVQARHVLTTSLVIRQTTAPAARKTTQTDGGRK